jgi:hypothetical protein
MVLLTELGKEEGRAFWRENRRFFFNILSLRFQWYS